jgi:hypothetical protein
VWSHVQVVSSRPNTLKNGNRKVAFFFNKKAIRRWLSVSCLGIKSIDLSSLVYCLRSGRKVYLLTCRTVFIRSIFIRFFNNKTCEFLQCLVFLLKLQHTFNHHLIMAIVGIFAKNESFFSVISVVI